MSAMPVATLTALGNFAEANATENLLQLSARARDLLYCTDAKVAIRKTLRVMYAMDTSSWEHQSMCYTTTIAMHMDEKDLSFSRLHLMRRGTQSCASQ